MCDGTAYKLLLTVPWIDRGPGITHAVKAKNAYFPSFWIYFHFSGGCGRKPVFRAFLRQSCFRVHGDSACLTNRLAGNGCAKASEFCQEGLRDGHAALLKAAHKDAPIPHHKVIRPYLKLCCHSGKEFHPDLSSGHPYGVSHVVCRAAPPCYSIVRSEEHTSELPPRLLPP